MKFVGGETAALSRVYEYFWKKVRSYIKVLMQIYVMKLLLQLQTDISLG